jgi:hypothetical protein
MDANTLSVSSFTRLAPSVILTQSATLPYPIARYVAMFGWSLAVWISFQPLIDRTQHNDASSKDQSIISTLAKLLFAFFVCMALLLAEKVAIQWIADKFHERSYAGMCNFGLPNQYIPDTCTERVEDQKRAIRAITILYANSTDVPGRSDTDDSGSLRTIAGQLPVKIFKTALRGVQSAASFTTSSLGSVASQLSGG